MAIIVEETQDLPQTEKAEEYTGKAKRTVEIDGKEYNIYDPPIIHFQWADVLCHEECHSPEIDKIPWGQVVVQKSLEEYF